MGTRAQRHGMERGIRRPLLSVTRLTVDHRLGQNSLILSRVTTNGTQCAAGGQNEPYSSVDCVQSIVSQNSIQLGNS
jgi:hypothetical protein